jgi:hypothetical protein
VDVFPLDTEAAPACGHDRDVGGARQERRDQRGRGVGHVFAVVEHQQDRPRVQEVDDALEEARAGGDLEPEGRGHRPVQCGRIGHRGQLAEVDAIGKAMRCPRGEMARQAGLAHTARTGQGQQPRVRERLVQRVELLLPPDEGVARQPEHGRCRRPLGGEDRPFGLSQIGRRLEPELLGQQAAEGLEGAEGVDVPTLLRQGLYTHRHQAFPVRVLGQRRFGSARGVRREARGQQQPGAGLQRTGPQLLQPARLDAHCVDLVDARVCPPPPEGERLRQRRRPRLRRLATVAVHLPDEGLEAGAVDEVGRAVQSIALVRRVEGQPGLVEH